MKIRSVKSSYGQDIFPELWQEAIFMNYGKVKTDNIAFVLKTTVETVEKEADRLGIGMLKYDPVWREKGYISLIRNNWHVLSLTQIAQLLNLEMPALERILRDDDFLIVKLGEMKPLCQNVVYKPLTKEQERITQRIKQIVSAEYIAPKNKPFDFKIWRSAQKTNRENPVRGEKILYNYNAVYDDVLLNGKTDGYTDEFLAALAEQGITGIWMQAQLTMLSYDPFAEKPDESYIVRRKNLRRLCERCAKYGIRIFLYMNEPRAREKRTIPSDLQGHCEKGFSSLCLQKKEVRDYLIGSVKELCLAVPEIAGIITITMSENLTHCYSHGATNCKCCEKIRPQQAAADVNNLILDGVRRAGTQTKVIANLWGWHEFMGWTKEMTKEGIDLLDNDVEVMLVSEYGKKIFKGGIESKVIDYSISNVGPSEESEEMLCYARARGKKIWAKIQVNNSWECSAVPYLPVYDLVAKHLNNLTAIGVEDLMLSWTLGGFPSVGLKLATDYYSKEGVDLASFFQNTFGEYASGMRKATKILSDAFENFPFSLNVLYFAPQTLGPGEFWNYHNSDLPATMVCFSYDDYEKYTQPFGIDVYLDQMKKLVEGFREGLAVMDGIGNENEQIVEVKRFARVAYLHFCSAFHHAKFSAEKKKGYPDRKIAANLADEEIKTVREVYRLQAQDSRIGFEASNHYFYYENNLLAKFVNLNYIKHNLLYGEGYDER